MAMYISGDLKVRIAGKDLMDCDKATQDILIRKGTEILDEREFED